MRLLTVAACVALGIASARAQTPGATASAESRAVGEGARSVIALVEGRKCISLDGAWRAIVDPYETGYYDYRRQPSGNGFFKDARPKSPGDLVEYDFDSSIELSVPGDWNTQRPELFYYEGTVWYRRKFNHVLKEHTRAFLRFDAANYEARVYLNGRELGRHVGGFTPFEFEVTGALAAGENSVVVKVDNTRRADGVPTTSTDWWNYGGLTRSVRLVKTPAAFVRDYSIAIDPKRPEVIRGWVRVDGASDGGDVRIELPDAGRSVVARLDRTGLATFEMPADGLARWAPETAVLHRVRIQYGEDVIEDRVGLRTIEVRGRDILLNGKPIFLRGICMHEERPVDGGRAFNTEHARTQLEWARALNCNFVRLAHYPHNEATLRAAEEMGFLVWAEIPVYWGIAFDSSSVYDNAERQLREMITRDRNRACAAMWSVANETPLTDSRLAFLRKLIDAAHRLDPTRPVTAALEVHYKDPATIEISDPLGQYLDILGCNEYLGWYDGPPEKADGVKWVTPYDKPLVISEFGAGAKRGRHGAAGERWTEEYQTAVYEHQTRMLDRIDFLRGVSPWILKDFRSPRRLLPGIQDNWNRKGLVSEKGERKAAFDVLAKWYAEKARTKSDGR